MVGKITNIWRAILGLLCLGGYLGHGAIGGAMVTGGAQDGAAANLVRQMLERSGNRDRPFPPESTVRYRFDFPLLQRYKNPVSALPAGSVLLRQPQSYFAKNKSLILSAAAVIGCLAAGVVALSLAILRRHRVEFILREREERLQLALEGSSDGFFDRNVVTGAAQYSPRWLEMLGYSLGDISPHLWAWEKLIHPDDKPMVMRALDDHLAGRTPQYAAEHRLRTKSGEWKWILARGKVVARDQAGRPLRIAGTHVDITERKQSEKKLREQAALLDKAQDAILVTDLDQQLLFWNKSAEHLYGWTADEVHHRKIQELLFPKDSSKLSEALAVVREKGEWMGEMTQMTRQGQAVLVQSRWTLVRDESGQSQKIMVVNTDFTEHKKLEAKLLRAQRLESIGTLASGIAHDLNNVLAPILMAVQYLRERAPDEECQSMLATLESSTQRGASIVKQVLTFARGIEGERILLQPKHLLKEMVKIAQETFPKDIEVTAQYSPRLWAVKGDPTQLHQVLLNLCLNARDAMPDGGKLSLIAENIDLDGYYAQMTPDAKAGPYIVLTVTDTGHGIPDELLDKIFDPFFTTKAVGKGTGLGLATALGIVKSHGGFMHVHSVWGKGSQFKVHLPATKTDQADATQTIPVAPPRGQGELVLVVDDEAPIRQITCRTLEENGYQVITANDGAEAVAVYAQNAGKIKVVLTDMVMPFMDGTATVRALHRINPEVQIIVASGMLTHKREAEAIGPGVRAFLSKPFTAEKLVGCLHEILTRK